MTDKSYIHSVCKGAIALGSGCMRCEKCADQLAARVKELEAELEAVGAGGVQALSAGPVELVDAARMAVEALDWHATSDKTIALWKRQQPALEALRNALAASPTPPAEQPAQPGAVDRTGCTAGTDEACTRRGCATSCPAATPEAAPVVKPGAVYAELPEPAWRTAYGVAFSEAQARGFADRTHALRQAAPKAAPVQEPHHWIVPEYGFLFPSEEAATRYLSNIGSEQKPIACYTKPQAAPAVDTTSLAVPQECPHILWFDDQELKPVMFAGNGAKRAALEAYRRASIQWNAHLFVRVAVNSKDDQYPCAAPQPAAPQAAPAQELEPFAWFTDWHPDGRKYAEKPHGFNEPGVLLDDSDLIREVWQPLYTTPQAAPPECHHRPPCVECVARTAHGGA